MRVSPAYYMDANPANTCDSCKEIIIILMVFLQISILYIIYPVILIGALALLLGLMLINLFGGNIPFIEENQSCFILGVSCNLNLSWISCCIFVLAYSLIPRKI